MDAEKQPLLSSVRNMTINGVFRPLTYEEVLQARHDVNWRRARFLLILMFWAIIAMFLSTIVCILVTAPKCNSFTNNMGPALAVPPVHMTFAPLISQGRTLTDDAMYTL
ncbi:uncharacterized protein LOC113509442 [Galleria mellonella]|uniref:Uncharacterized protein LOC113509442 n=1 Tax=Galleria mellonella TaxID=7137 RepID=A0A6J1WE09_GALME|nr:uncharacterized protein LOC113509442 [Galleria mellonella]